MDFLLVAGMSSNMAAAVASTLPSNLHLVICNNIGVMNVVMRVHRMLCFVVSILFFITNLIFRIHLLGPLVDIAVKSLYLISRLGMAAWVHLI